MSEKLGTNLAEVGTDKNVGNNEDTISRQVAIDAICAICGNDCDKSEFIYNAPQDEQVIMCPEHYALSTLPPAQPEPCEDAVSKEIILKFFDDWMSVLDENCHNQSVSDLKIIKRDFENLPPVTPKQRTGKWIVPSQVPDMVRGYWAKCSACGHSTFGGGKFCRECGAPMNQSNKTCDCYRSGRCVGTKEIDSCSCGGVKSKCDFYVNVRREGDTE